jgi:phage terminase Nu1 subunit (DNA packaging protein)
MKSNSKQPKSPVIGQVVSVSQLSQLIGIKTRSVREMISDGCPVYEAGGPGVGSKLDMGAVWIWANRDRKRPKLGRPATELNKDDPKYRIQEAEAQMRELELSKQLGEIVLVADIEPFARDQVVKLRVRAVEIISRFRQKFGDEIGGELDVEMRGMLNAYGNGLLTIADKTEAAD